MTASWPSAGATSTPSSSTSSRCAPESCPAVRPAWGGQRRCGLRGMQRSRVILPSAAAIQHAGDEAPCVRGVWRAAARDSPPAGQAVQRAGQCVPRHGGLRCSEPQLPLLLCMSAFSHTQAAAAAAAALQPGLPTSASTTPSSCLASPSDLCLGPIRTLQVGMGLNLNIRRVIFHAVTKREGERSLGDTILRLLPYCTSVWMRKNKLHDVGRSGHARRDTCSPSPPTTPLPLLLQAPRPTCPSA